MRALHLLIPDTKREDGWLSLDGKGLIASFTILELIVGMSDNLAFDQVDHFFGDVGGVIANAFQMS